MGRVCEQLLAGSARAFNNVEPYRCMLMWRSFGIHDGLVMFFGETISPAYNTEFSAWLNKASLAFYDLVSARYTPPLNFSITREVVSKTLFAYSNILGSSIVRQYLEDQLRTGRSEAGEIIDFMHLRRIPRACPWMNAILVTYKYLH